MNSPHLSPEMATQLLERFGITPTDLPAIMQAAQVVLGAQGGQRAAVSAAATQQGLTPEQKQAMGIPLLADSRGSVIAGRPGANNEIPNKPIPDDAQMLTGIFGTDRPGRYAA